MSNSIDLPADLYQQALEIARNTTSDINDVVARYLRRALESEQSKPAVVHRSEKTGLPVIKLGRVITVSDVRQLEDEER